MTKEDFRSFLEDAKRKGFTHVSTLAGPVPLDRWSPYGAFSVNEGIEKYFDFTWIDEFHARDGEPSDKFPAGVWEFLTIEEP